MIKANELRIHNYLDYKGSLFILDVKMIYAFSSGDLQYNMDELNPIPLTEEILLNFGFEKGGSEWILSTKESSFIIEQEDDKFYYTGGEGCKLSRYFDKVHELQNLAFEIERIELKLN